jgi:drug/metabolite transporter (DMT)-like permease
MRAADIGELLLLAAVWGASFLFMRLGAAEFGPVALSALRVGGAALCLLPLLQWRGQMAELRQHWRPILVVGVLNSALPFLCYGYAALSVTAGLMSIFNAATPLFGAVVAWLWLNDRLSASRIAGLVVGFAGVAWLAWDKASFKPGGSGWAVLACIAAALMYGVAASFTKRRLTGVAPLAVAAGSQLGAVLVLVLPALWWWPRATPSATAWVATLLLAVLCTALAYVLFFRLIAHIGPARAISVTFLIPAFAVLWGALFLAEELGASMLLGCGAILLGTGMSTGLLRWPARLRSAP